MQEVAPTKTVDYFNTEERALVYLNPYLLKFMTSLFLKETSILLSHPLYLPNLFNIHLSMAIYLQKDSPIVVKKLYKSILNILFFIEEHLEESVRSKAIDKILLNELLHKMTTSIDFDYSEGKYTT